MTAAGAREVKGRDCTGTDVMRRRLDDPPSLRGPIVCCLLAVVALSLGPSGEAAVRAAVRDAARPGYRVAGVLRSCSARLDFDRWPWSERPDPAAVPSDLPANGIAQAELRRLRAELATARRDLTAFDASLGPIARVAASSAASPSVERVVARILNASDPAVGPAGMVVDAGSKEGVESGQPAVGAVTLAAGASAGVPGDALVLTGAAVVGKTDEVGAWTSTIVPVSDVAFRAHVRIVRETADGPAFGEEGLLEGDGRDGCVVKYVPSTAAVAAGDHVYSHDPSGRIPQPLYFGRIESASLREGAPHWEIRVRPAADIRAASEVHVLRPLIPELVRTAASDGP